MRVSQSNFPQVTMNVARHVLLVEDEPRLREMLVRAVTDMGFEPYGVGSAEAAMRALEERPFEIIVLDLTLPGMNGMEFFERLRAKDAAMQVIVLTGFGDLGAARRAMHLDAVEFLTKPCPLGDLEAALERARARRQKLMATPAGNPLPAISPIDPETVAPHAPVGAAAASAPPPPASEPSLTMTGENGTALSLEAVERRHILAVLEKNHGNRTATAAELGISLRKLYYRLGQYQREAAAK
jgi:DNA-binding NtrC family response regulator